MREGQCLIDRRLIAPLAALLLTLAGPAVDALDLDLQVRPNPVVAGEQATVSITLSAAEASAVTADPFTLPAGLQLSSGPFIRPYVDERDPSAAKVRVSYLLSTTATGRYVVPPITIRAPGGSAETRAFVLSVGISRDGSILVPPTLRWRPLVSPIYAGETIPLALELENEESAVVVDSLSLPPLPGSFAPAAGLLSTSVVTVGDGKLYTIPAAVYELTPPSPGPITLPAATVRVGGLTGGADPLTLMVLPEPAGIGESGAIGSFAFRASTESAGRPGAIRLRLEISGEGNLGYLRLPTPVTTNLLTVDEQETKSFTPSLKGYSGSRERIFHYLAVGEGVASVRIPDFSWFDPQDKQLHRQPGRLLSLPSLPAAGQAPSAASPPPEAAAPPSGLPAKAQEAPPFRPEPWPAIEGASYRDLAAEPFSYVWLLPGPLFFLFALLGRRFTRGTPVALLFCLLLLGSTPPASSKLAPIAAKALADYDAGRLESALAGFSGGLAIEPKNAALFYDLGLAEYRLGMSGYAVNAVRSAIFYDPTSASYRRLLDWMIHALSVPEQVPAVSPVHPDLFFLGLLLSVNLAGLAGGLLLLRRGAGWVILLGLCAVLALGSAGGLLYTAAARSVKTAVVAQARTEMKKIPVHSAGRWLDLSEGMAVHVLGDAGDYDLVETGYGIKGWVRKEALLADGSLHPVP